MYRAPAPPSPLVIVSTGNRVVAHDRQTGEPVWEFITSKSNVRGGLRSIVEGAQVLVFAVGDMEGTWSADAPLVISCLDYVSGTPRWERTIPTATNVAHVASTALIDGNQILVVCANQLLAFALHDGTPQWSQPLRTEADSSVPAGLAIPGATAHADRR